MAQITVDMCDQIQTDINVGQIPSLTVWEIYQLAHMAKCFLSDQMKESRDKHLISLSCLSRPYTGDRFAPDKKL